MTDLVADLKKLSPIDDQLTTQLMSLFISNCYTTHKVNKRVRNLKNFLTQKIFNSEGLDEEIDSEELEWVSNLDESLLEKINKDNLGPIFQKIDADLKALKVLTIYFAVQIPQNELDRLGIWLRQNFLKDMLFESRLDPTLLAGSALVWNGVYKDYSIRAKIQEKKIQLIESLKTFRS